MLAALLLAVLGLFMPLPDMIRVPSLIPGWTGVVIGSTCLLQISISLRLDQEYDVGLWKVYFWMIWYPLLYWIINMLTIVVALPKVIVREKKQRAIWISPDRGIKEK